MAENIDKHRTAYQKFFDAVNSGVFENLEPALRELFIPGFILHTVGGAEPDKTLDECFEEMKRDWEKYSSQRLTFVDCFSAGDMMAAHVNYETVAKETNEKRKIDLVWVDRFEGDRIAVEWVW
jgi:hypothetical protein